MKRALLVAALAAILVLALAERERGERPTAEFAGRETIGPDGGQMVWVPPGEFTMGARDSLADQGPVHRVRITQGFWLGKCPVTNAQYRRFCRETGRGFPRYSDQPDSHPVVCANWYDASAYCRLYGMRLPTEAEWEYAARGPDGRTYPWGDTWDQARCCNAGNQGAGRKTLPAGSLPQGASWCGVLDMAGNVWEWCADWYGRWYYTASPDTDPPGPSFGKLRVLRGGSWYDFQGDCRSSFRNADHPMRRRVTYGFRCAMSAR